MAQNQPGKVLHVYKTHTAVKIDGELNDEAWLNTDTAKNFFQNYPNDTLLALNQTEAWVTFDNRFLYVAFKCFTGSPVTQNMRRDFNALSLNDIVYINFGGFDDNSNAYWFGVSHPGVQYDGAISNGGDTEDSYNDSWNAKWYAKSKVINGTWTGEMAIPFKSFRYSNKVQWDVNFLRGDAHNNQLSHWIKVPSQFMVGSQAFQGKMVTDTLLPDPRKNFVIIPYSTYSINNDPEIDLSNDHESRTGFDARIGVTSSMNLDLTFNPDFSDIEADQQVVNLTRFEYNFPERRQFFLENSDLFAQLGLPNARPFFTRRIGLAEDSTATLQKVPILFGLRFSGKPSSAWRIGILNMQTQGVSTLGLPDQNYSMAAAQFRVLSRSFFSGFIINKQSIGLNVYDSTLYYHPDLLHKYSDEGKPLVALNKYNRVAGIEFNLLTKNNKWSGKTFYHRSFDPFHHDQNFSFGFQADYNVRKVGFRWTHQKLGEKFNAETGFLPGLDIYRGFWSNTFRGRTTFYFSKRKIVKIEPSFEGNFNQLPDRSLTDQNITLANQLFFANQALLKFELRHWYQKLPDDFNPIWPEGNSNLLKGESFEWNEFEILLQADQRRRLTYTIGTAGGEFYNGNRKSIFGEIIYRYPPFLTFSSTFNFTSIRLPEIYGKADFILVSPKLDITFTPNVSLSTFSQYNTRNNNVNLNARFQWRFKPMSDIFIVYTENYIPQNFSTKNRALVLKVTYWLNL